MSPSVKILKYKEPDLGNCSLIAHLWHLDASFLHYLSNKNRTCY